MFQKGTRCDFTLEAQKAQSFENMPRTFLNKKTHKKSEHPKGAFLARKTLQRFGFSVLGHMVALLFELRPPPCKTLFT